MFSGGLGSVEYGFSILELVKVCSQGVLLVFYVFAIDIQILVHSWPDFSSNHSDLTSNSLSGLHLCH